MESREKIAVISGGASGLGRAAAEVLVQQGLKVALFDLNQEAGEAAATELGREKALYAKVDVTCAESTANGIQKVLENFGAIHVCLNCAGIAPARKILDRHNEAMPLEDFSRAININLVGSFNLARLTAEQMAKNDPIGESGERGVIINTASVAAYEGQMGQCSYAASKGGIIGMTLPMARDLAKTGIRVNAIAPGIMGTPMLLAMPDNVQESLVKNIQFPKRMGLPEEFGKLALHIIENAYINAETVRLDGAIRMPPS